MTISAILPFYNRAATIRRALKSILDQTNSVNKIVLIDDGSTDDWKDQVEDLIENPLIDLIQTPNRGVSHARNIGIEHAQSEWVALLDSDDMWKPNKIQMIKDFSHSEKEQNLIHSNEDWILNGKPLTQLKKHKKYGGYIFDKCLPLCSISPSASLFRRALWSDIGKFDEKMPVCEDYDFWLRVCTKHPAHFITESLVTKFGGHQDQLSRKYRAMDYWRLYALTKWILKNPNKTIHHSLVIEEILKKSNILIQGSKKHGNDELLKKTIELLHSISNEKGISSTLAQVSLPQQELQTLPN